MAAQFFHARAEWSGTPQLYTLVFKNGDTLQHQDSLAVVQYLADARLHQVRPEGLKESLTRVPTPFPHRVMP